MNPIKSVYLRLIACELGIAALAAFALVQALYYQFHLGSFTLAVGLALWIAYLVLTYIEMQEFMHSVNQCDSCSCDDKDDQL